jgi:UDP-glucuronate 4-epimerase
MYMKDGSAEKLHLQQDLVEIKAETTMTQHTLYTRPLIVTGAAGFIGYHTIEALIAKGVRNIIGIDNCNDYYDPALKDARLKALAKHGDAVTFYHIDIADADALNKVFTEHKPLGVIHLAAQAGVRYSLENPHAYVRSNLDGFMNMLEMARHHNVKHMVYASSSSVYGANQKLPYSESDVTDHPVSLYAATKKSNELLAFSYASMYGIALTGLRFFTVYGPFGRPDMAYFKFTQSIYAGKPITVYNNGNMMRDFTYVDDIVTGVIASLESIPEPTEFGNTSAPARVFNIGNNNPENLGEFIDILEKHIGKKAIREYAPVQTGDVLSTYADIARINTATGFKPTTSLDKGLEKFIAWYKSYYNTSI